MSLFYSTLSEIIAFRPLSFVAVAVTDMSLQRDTELIRPEILIMSAPSFQMLEEIRYSSLVIHHFDFISGLDKVSTSYLICSMEDGDDQQTIRTNLNKLLIAAVGFMLSSVFCNKKRIEEIKLP